MKDFSFRAELIPISEATFQNPGERKKSRRNKEERLGKRPEGERHRSVLRCLCKYSIWLAKCELVKGIPPNTPDFDGP